MNNLAKPRFIMLKNMVLFLLMFVASVVFWSTAKAEILIWTDTGARQYSINVFKVTGPVTQVDNKKVIGDDVCGNVCAIEIDFTQYSANKQDYEWCVRGYDTDMRWDSDDVSIFRCSKVMYTSSAPQPIPLVDTVVPYHKLSADNRLYCTGILGAYRYRYWSQHGPSEGSLNAQCQSQSFSALPVSYWPNSWQIGFSVIINGSEQIVWTNVVNIQY